jgi:mono/diheme cytochrome c family protein
MHRVSLVTFSLASLCFAADWQANADRGPSVLKEQGCTNCHAIGSSGKGVAATALSRALNREYTPAGLTATLWNHAPQMWSAMEAKGMTKPSMSEQDAADVFAYFASLRYFEQMGESSRGARLFRSKQCVECHAVAGKGSGVALPVTEWDAVDDPLALVGKMWNHIPQMRVAMSKRKVNWPSLNPQELSDIMLYVRGLREAKGVRPSMSFEMPSLEGAEGLVEAHGCATCHKGELQFDRQLGDRTLTEISAAMWNHGPKMVQNPATIPPGEMRKIVGWVCLGTPVRAANRERWTRPPGRRIEEVPDVPRSERPSTGVCLSPETLLGRAPDVSAVEARSGYAAADASEEHRLAALQPGQRREPDRLYRHEIGRTR